MHAKLCDNIICNVNINTGNIVMFTDCMIHGGPINISVKYSKGVHYCYYKYVWKVIKIHIFLAGCVLYNVLKHEQSIQ